MTRHCSRCQTEVEDRGGYCLLGHPLKLSMPVTPLAELRAEVDRAFEETADRVAALLGPAADEPAGEDAMAFPEPTEAESQALAEPPQRRMPPPPPPPPAAKPVTPQPHARKVSPVVAPFISNSLPLPIPGSVPPVRAEEPSKKQFGGYAPPSSPAVPPEVAGMWDGLDVQAPLDAGDPITAFAPPTRMDWGPERKKSKRSGLKRLRELQAQRAQEQLEQHQAEEDPEPQEQSA